MIDPELATLRGAVRDGVFSIENLANVLSSRRVGPKVIARALPEVRSGCLALDAGIQRLRAELPRLLGNDSAGVAAANEMLEHASSRVLSLAADLEQRRSASVPIDARERLALESTVRRVAGELAGVVRVIDLLSVASNPRATALDFGELLAQKHTLTGAGSQPVTVTMDLGDAPGLVGDARVMIGLLVFWLATVVRAGVSSPALVARAAPSGLAIEIGPATGPFRANTTKVVLEVPARSALPRESDVIRAAAQLAGIEVQCDATGQRVTLLVKG